jgi:hypothetical protein
MNECRHMSKLVPLNDADGLKAAGIGYPGTEHAWRWLFRQRHERKLAGAFKRVGRRVLVDTEEYLRLIKEQTE